MPDNKNPPENDQTKKPEEESENISRVDNIKICEHQDCKKPALSLSYYCWEHIKERNEDEEYQTKIYEWANAGKSMERFILTGAILSGLLLGGSNLSGAWLEGTNLFGAVLWGANLSGTWLERANLGMANLQNTDLSGAQLWGAKLYNAQLDWAKLTGAICLTKKNFSYDLTKEEREKAEDFKWSYLTVKNYFIQNGLYDDASWAAFRERTLERIAWYKETKLKGIKDLFSWNRWKAAFKWSRSMLMNLLCGYGEKPWKAVVSSMVIIVGFFLFYLFKEYIKANPPEALHWWDYLYFSIVTFTTLGYGDIRPLPAPGARMVASGEAFIGAFMIALFVWTLARRYVAR